MERYPIELPVDREHSGIRLAVPAILFVLFWFSYFAVDALLKAVWPDVGNTLFLSCIGALPLSLGTSWLIERWLKQIWLSGRQLIVTPGKVRLEEDEGEEAVVVTLSQRVNDRWWFLPLAGYPRGGRERRISAKWYCFAGKIQEDEARIVVFCYAPPRQARRWLASYTFRELDPKDVYDTRLTARLTAPDRPELPPQVITGGDGQYWLAERERWTVGVELDAEDFAVLLETVRRTSPAQA